MHRRTEQPDGTAPTTPPRVDGVDLLGMLEVITGVLRTFANLPPTELDRAIDRALETIGTFAGVDRSYLFQFRPDGASMANTHEWCADGVAPQIDTLQHVPVAVAGDWLDTLGAGHHVYIPVVEDLPDDRAEERDHLAAQGIQSLVVVPLVRDGQLIGLLGFDAVRCRRSWCDAELLLLRSVADVIVGGLRGREAFDALQHQALHDPLTGLPNRTLFHQRLEAAIRAGDQAGTSVGVVFVDVDRFKVVNDSLGHRIGDELLVEIAARLRTTVRTEDAVARFGGDEFVVLLDALDGPEAAAAAAARLLEAFEAPFLLDGREHRLSASAGLVVAGVDADADTLVRDADAAMYQAKERGRGRVARFDAPLRDRLLRRLELGRDLPLAAARGELAVAYQPIRSLRDGSTVAVEALLRWTHPVHGPVSPAEFVPIAEENGDILAVGAWVLDEALAQLRRWDDELGIGPVWGGATGLIASVNLSVHQLRDGDLPRTVEDALRRHRIAADRLCLELTESTLMAEPEVAIAVLGELRSLGIRLAIDDFGTGYSSFAYLRDLPVTSLKIDRSFVQGLGTRRRDARLVAALLGLARELGLHAIAEGVETDLQLQELRHLGVELAQGYRLRRPVTADELHDELRPAPLQRPA
jgi:diguanylate cyclase (GGDEF)-like protein